MIFNFVKICIGKEGSLRSKSITPTHPLNNTSPTIYYNHSFTPAAEPHGNTAN